MKKRFITKCLAGVIACSMAISPLSVYAGGDPNANYTPIEENTGDVSTNYSDIENNSGTVESNGTSEVQTAIIESNSGTVVENYAIVDYNNAGGTVENNCFRGTIDTNNGQVDSNSGTVNINNGNIDKTNATVGVNKGTIGTANYYSNINTNSETGSIDTNYGSVRENDGTITNNEVTGPFTGTVETNYGTVENNNGYVKYNNNIINEIGETGDVAYNNGTVEVNKSKDNHGIAINRGTIVDNSGRVDTNEQNGIINNNSEYVSTNEGTVETNTGKIVLNTGEVTDNFGEIEWNFNEVINNFGGIVRGNKALNEFFEYILGDGGAVDDANSDTLRTVDNRTWVGTNQDNKENVKLTVKANSGKTLDAVTDEEGNSINATDNGDGTWTIIGAMKKLFFSWGTKSDPTPGPNPGPNPGPSPDPNPWVEPENIVEVYESEVAENVAAVSKTTILVVVDNLTDEEIKLVTCFLKGAASVKGKNVEYKFVTSKELTADNLASANFVLNVSKLGTKKAAKIANVKSFNLWLVDNDEYTSDASNIYINVNEDSNNVAEAGKLFAKLF
ncbi:MAG: hypothetical protein MJ244_02675 [Clostridia bacterium]|nr:hypothetical protein [Clostridia bacterium]